ncbi:MAG TPA: hypothetical protein VG938_17375 [Verrucomicrobiae bacterium]|jgi:hypothetical protein|nr:hypothetical protein [Verrucomicrobiae bacterium]
MRFVIPIFRFAILVAAFCLLSSAFGQTVLEAPGIAAFHRPAATGGGGGGGGTYTLLRHATGNAPGNSQASVTIDVTGGKLLVVSVSNYQPAGGGLDRDPADGGVNTYIGLNKAGSPTGHIATNQLFYVINPSGSSLTITCTHSYVILNAAVFSYSGSSPSLDTQAAGHGTAASSVQPGSVTPSGTELFVTGVSSSQSFAGTPINSSFTVTDAVRQGANGLWGGLAYKNSSSAENPTWSFSASADCGSTMATFK